MNMKERLMIAKLLNDLRKDPELAAKLIENIDSYFEVAVDNGGKSWES